MATRIIIPARLASVRLPNKILLSINHKPMLQHVYELAKQCKAHSVLIAADDNKVVEVAKYFSADVFLTKKQHLSGSSRISEVCQHFGYAKEDTIVCLQADEPLMPISNIQQVADNLVNHNADVATLCEPVVSTSEMFDANCVKVVRDKHNFAMYFSRAQIPWVRGSFPDSMPSDMQAYRHIGLYAYKCEFLLQYPFLESCKQEEYEKLEQLRFLWHGYKIHVDNAKQVTPHGVDTQEDLDNVRKIFESK